MKVNSAIKEPKIEPEYTLSYEDIKKAEGVYKPNAKYEGDVFILVLTKADAAASVLYYAPVSGILEPAVSSGWAHYKYRKLKAEVNFSITE